MVFHCSMMKTVILLTLFAVSYSANSISHEEIPKYDVPGSEVSDLLAVEEVKNNEKKVVCYFSSWSINRHGSGKFKISYIKPHLCTHLIYAFAGLSSNGVIKSLDPYADLPDNYGLNGYGQFNYLKKINPNLKTLLAMGGWNEGSIKYSKAVKTAESRTKLADSIVEFVQKYNFDGFDLDWEYPAQRTGAKEDVQNFILLLKELKAKLSKRGLLLTVAVGASEHSASISYDIPELVKTVDFINMMTYDYHGSWDSTLGIVAPLYDSPEEKGFRATLNANSSVHYWLSKGAPAEKLILGVPFYARTFKLANPKLTKPGSPNAGPGKVGPHSNTEGILFYFELMDYFTKEKWTHEFETHQKVPYAYKDDQWVGYDNSESLIEKSNYIIKHNLGGAMIWSIEADDFRGINGETFPLLKTLNYVLRPDVESVTHPTYTSSTNSPLFTTSTTKSSEQTVNPTSTSTKSSENEDEICSYEGYVRDPKDCTVFYYCQRFGYEWRVHTFQCPADLFFNTEISVCDWPANVDCVMQYPG